MIVVESLGIGFFENNCIMFLFLFIEVLVFVELEFFLFFKIVLSVGGFFK